MRRLVAWGYVLKESAVDEINDCIHTVSLGTTFVSASLSRLVAPNDDLGVEQDSGSRLVLLSKTERRLLVEIARSMSRASTFTAGRRPDPTNETRAGPLGATRNQLQQIPGRFRNVDRAKRPRPVKH
jgi:hypothetical protein